MAAGKRYSAGAIFLQVVPVFANVQREIERHAKDMDKSLGDQMEKSGDKAGERAGKAASQSMNREIKKGVSQFERDFDESVGRIQKSLDGINPNKMSNGVRKEIASIKRELAGLKDTDLTVDANFGQAEAKIAALKARLEELRKGAKIVYRADIDDALRGIAKVETAIKAIDPKIELDVDTKPAERAMSGFERSFKRTADKAAKHLSGAMHKEAIRIREDLVALGNLRIGVDISANKARAELAELMAELEHLSHEDPNIDVKVDTGRAWAELAAFETALKKIDGQDVTVDVNVDTKGAAREAGDAANTFRSFNAIILALTTVGPALVPVLGAIAGGLLAIGPAAAVGAAGLGAVIIGFSGIQDAVTALQAQQDQSGMTAQTSAKQQGTAQRAIADAHRSAARQIQSALQSQADAQRSYAQSVKDVQSAEEDLAQARADARGTGQDIANKIAENRLAQQQGLLDEFNAKVNYDSVRSDGSATNAEVEQARIDWKQAQLRQKELRKEQRDLAREKKKWDKEGVDGTDSVKAAQDRLTSAIQSQQDALRSLHRAQQNVDQARADGARQVAEAIRAQADAADQLSSQQNKVNSAFDKLGPAGQRFARFIFALKQDFYDLRDAIQAVLLPRVQHALESFLGSKSGDILRKAMIRLADSFGRIVEMLSRSFQGKAWQGFFEMLARLGPKIQAAYGRAFVKFLEAMASIMTTLAPFALDFANAFAKMMDSFARWARSKKGRDALGDFMEWAKKTGPDVVDFLRSLVHFAIKLAVAMAPWGDVVLKGLTGVMDVLSSLDPKILAGLTTAIIVLIAASQAAYGIMSLVYALGALSSLAIGPWILAIGVMIAIFAALYVKNDQFRAFVKKAWAEISDAFSQAWDSIKPALADLTDALDQAWHEVLQPFFAWLGPILLWLAKKIIPLIGKYFAIQIHGIAFLIRDVWIPIIHWMVYAVKTSWTQMKWWWEHVLRPVWHAIADAAGWLWREVLKPVWDDMKDAWHDLMTGMKWTWDHVLHPVFNFIAHTALPALESAFENTVSAIGTLWDGLKRIVGAPIKFVLDTIINKGLIAGFNKVAGWVGMDGFDPIDIPKGLQQYAAGGVMPGYTPGRDVHTFVSPTAGRLELSGGEAVMRPEWTAAMGPDYVNQMNAIARTSGTRGIRKAMGMGGYWMGGVLPLPGASFRQHTSGYSDFAGDLNYGSGYDDYGMAIKAWKDGIVAQMNYIGDASYGRWVVLNHAANQASLYAHMSAFGPEKVGDKVRAGQTIGHVGDLGNTGTPPTSHLHFEIMGGNVDFADNSTGHSKPDHPSIPGFVKDVLLHPIDTIKGWATSQFSKASDAITASPVWDVVKSVPGNLIGGFEHKVWDIMPGWAKKTVGVAADLAGAAGDLVGGVAHGAGHVAGEVGDFLGLATGGILPYNGTMKYDAGGYLPPGLTSVVNLTGKPEPVFTDGQWSDMTGGGQGGNIHYEPHFEGSDLTAEDVAGDMNFTFRRLRRAGKFESVGNQ